MHSLRGSANPSSHCYVNFMRTVDCSSWQLVTCCQATTVSRSTACAPCQVVVLSGRTQSGGAPVRVLEHSALLRQRLT